MELLKIEQKPHSKLSLIVEKILNDKPIRKRNEKKLIRRKQQYGIRKDQINYKQKVNDS